MTIRQPKVSQSEIDALPPEVLRILRSIPPSEAVVEACALARRDGIKTGMRRAAEIARGKYRDGANFISETIAAAILTETQRGEQE